MANKVLKDLGENIKVVGDNAASEMRDATSEIIGNGPGVYEGKINKIKTHAPTPKVFQSQAESQIETAKIFAQATLEAELDETQIANNSKNLKNAIEGVQVFEGETGARLSEAASMDRQKRQEFITQTGTFEYFQIGFDSVEQPVDLAKFVVGDEMVNFRPDAKFVVEGGIQDELLEAKALEGGPAALEGGLEDVPDAEDIP